MRDWGGDAGLMRVRRLVDGLGRRVMKRIKLSLKRLGRARPCRGRFTHQGGRRIPIIRTAHRCMLGIEGRSQRAAERAGRWSHSTGRQQCGWAVEERLEESRHFLQLLTHNGYLAGEDRHLEDGRMCASLLDMLACPDNF